MERYKETYRIPSARLANWDYGSPGLYFITICTQNREHFFGGVLSENDLAAPMKRKAETEQLMSHSPSSEINVPSGESIIQYTEIGQVTNQYWHQIPQFSPFVELDAYILMPNHLHGILFLNKPEHNQWQPNKFGPQSQNLASVIRGLKAAVKKYATLNNLSFAWQSRYFDRVIRTEKELQNIRTYIQNNPLKWEADKHNPENLLMEFPCRDAIPCVLLVQILRMLK